MVVMNPTATNGEGAELARLLRQVATGDQAAFARLYDLTCARVYGLAVRVCRDRAVAEDVLQETYLQVWRAADAFCPEQGSASSWLLTIAHRRAVDRVRSEVAARRREQEYSDENTPTAASDTVDLVVSREEGDAVRNCLAKLTDAQRESIALAYFGGLSYPEVAQRLRLGLPAVKSRIRDGMRKLRECMEVRNDA